MIARPQEPTRADPLFPYPTLIHSLPVRQRSRSQIRRVLPAPATTSARRSPCAVAHALLRRRTRPHRRGDHRRRRPVAVSDTLLVEARGAVEIATLNRPERLNALNGDLVDELNAYFGGLAERREVRVVILRGAGRGFCAGLDIQEDRATDETPVLRTLRTQTSIGNIYRKMRACPQPIIALGHGAAAGGRLSLLLAPKSGLSGKCDAVRREPGGGRSI